VWTKNTAATLSEIQNGRETVPKPLLGLRGHEKALRRALWKSEGPKNRFGSTSGNPNNRENASAAALEIRATEKPFRKPF
jgi:hypothetical protein